MIAHQTAAAYLSSHIYLRGKHSKSWSDWGPRRVSTLYQTPQYGTTSADSPHQRYARTALSPDICSMPPAHAPHALLKGLDCSAAVQTVTATHVRTKSTWKDTFTTAYLRYYSMVSCRAA